MKIPLINPEYAILKPTSCQSAALELAMRVTKRVRSKPVGHVTVVNLIWDPNLS
jgi:hypothetical protein